MTETVSVVVAGARGGFNVASGGGSKKVGTRDSELEFSKEEPHSTWCEDPLSPWSPSEILRFIVLFRNNKTPFGDLLVGRERIVAQDTMTPNNWQVRVGGRHGERKACELHVRNKQGAW
jgi:hypothetical protein